MIRYSFYLALLIVNFSANGEKKFKPCIAGTWQFSSIAIDQARRLLNSGASAVDAVEEGIQVVELDQKEQYFVGVGGLPNAEGKMELDAAIMDSLSNFGAVMGLQNIETPISVARTVMEGSPHNVLCGEGALTWAISRRFKANNILTPASKLEYEEWLRTKQSDSEDSHDTVGLICLDSDGKLCVGTSTSGWKFKHPGRVGDSPLVGSGLFCDGKIGAAVATGDGEEIMRTCLSFLVVEFLRQGHKVQEACRLGIKRLMELPQPDSSLGAMHTRLTVGVVAMDIHGNVGGASTLGTDNLHRGNPFFPVLCWRSYDDDNRINSGDYHVLKADREGDSF